MVKRKLLKIFFREKLRLGRRVEVLSVAWSWYCDDNKAIVDNSPV